jgi:hypothetical protein
MDTKTIQFRQKALAVRKLSERLSKGTICIGDFMRIWYNANPDIVSYGGVDLHRLRLTIIIKKGLHLFIGRLDQQTSISTYLYLLLI